MLESRIIPTLLIENRELFKTTKFKKPNYLGDPINIIRIFNDKEADELAIFDIGVSKNGNGPDFDYLSKINKEAFMPLSYGGGIRNLEDAKKIISLGYEKIIINSTALKNPILIKELSDILGSSAITVCIDLKRKMFGKSYHVYNHVKKEIIKEKSTSEWINEVINLGAGEIILHFVDLEGTYSGYDIKYISEANKLISVPIIALGGATSFENMFELISNQNISAAAGSVFVYQGNNKAVLISYPK